MPAPLPDQPAVPSPPGDSTEQRQAEALMLAALNADLGLNLAPARFVLPQGGYVAIDGVDQDAHAYVEAFAHQGPLKSGQVRKVVMDAFKLAFVGRMQDPSRLILAFSDGEAAAPFKSKRWFAQAIQQLGIEVRVVQLPEHVIQALRDAQKRQYR